MGDTSNPRAARADPFDRLAGLLPGDALALGARVALRVTSVFLCREVIAGRVYEWRWAFLGDGSLIEAAPKGCYRYRRHRVLEQGTGPYEELVAQDGALVRFEARVRAGTSDRRPVRVTIDGTEYRVISTGTVAARRLGDEPNLASWRSFRENPTENVYFGLRDTRDESNVVLGLWTTDVCLSFGRPLRTGLTKSPPPRRSRGR